MRAEAAHVGDVAAAEPVPRDYFTHDLGERAVLRGAEPQETVNRAALQVYAEAGEKLIQGIGEEIGLILLLHAPAHGQLEGRRVAREGRHFQSHLLQTERGCL